MHKYSPKSQAFYERAMRVMPHGVSSNYRYYGNDKSPVVADAQDAYVYDFDGNRYIDYRLGWGPIILGHTDPTVTERVKAAIDRGVSFASTQEFEVSVAERIIDLCPGVEMVRLANTGAECTMHALRLARGYTGRDLILKFEGSYHGAHDNMLWSMISADMDQVGDRHRPIPYRQSLGVPDVMQELLLLCPWNDEEIFGDILQKRGSEIAAVIVEPVMGNNNALMPRPGYLEFLRAQCDAHGIVLIFDEVKTGFRIAPGGAREYFGVMPDLSTYAKAMGNGYPIAAIGGHREIMMAFSPGKVFQGGTYTGNRVSTAAADATLELIQSGVVFDQINQVGAMLMDGIVEILTRHNLSHFINGTPGMFGFCLAETQPHDWRDLQACDWAPSTIIFDHLIENGVLPEPGGYEPFFLCMAHTQAHVTKTLELMEEGVRLALA